VIGKKIRKGALDNDRKQNHKERLKEITERIETSIMEFFRKTSTKAIFNT